MTDRALILTRQSLTLKDSMSLDSQEERARAYCHERGYAIVTRADGTVLQDAAEVSAGDEIEARLRRGSLKARVT